MRIALYNKEAFYYHYTNNKIARNIILFDITKEKKLIKDFIKLDERNTTKLSIFLPLVIYKHRT